MLVPLFDARSHVTFLGPKIAPKVCVKEVAFKKYHKKYFMRLYISRYSFVPTNPLLAATRIFSKISFAHLLNGEPSKKNCTAWAIASYRQNKQNLRCTNNANRSREVLPKKLSVLHLTPKHLEKSTRLYVIIDNRQLHLTT